MVMDERSVLLEMVSSSQTTWRTGLTLLRAREAGRICTREEEQGLLILISGFCHNVDEICALLGYYTASCGNCLPTFQDNVSVPSSRILDP
jgi:hypothetical protein